MNETWQPIPTIALSVSNGDVTATSLVKKSIERIEHYQEYQAIITLMKDSALQRAAEIDKKIKAKEPVGRLAGVPFIAKDNFLVFGAETTAASNILKGFEAPYQSTAIEKLESEGAICVAKANLDAFAHGSSTENSDFFTTKNPHDPTRVPGGSSGGSAAAVALKLAPFALGTDTGGSVRLPASFTGVVGYKPTYGLVSRSGVIAMASSTDVVGPLASTVEEVALILDVIAGSDPLDSTSIQRQPTYLDLKGDVKGKKIGLIKEYLADGVSEEVKEAIVNSADRLKERGAEVIEISMPSLALALAAYYIICPAEVSSNLARYDGQRFGHHITAKDLDESYEVTRQQGFGAEAKRRIMIGTYVLSSGYYDAYYKKAQTVRTKLVNEFNNTFKNVDFLMGPVAPTTAYKIGQNSDDPLSAYLVDIMTVSASLVGIPAISVPGGVDKNNLPIGVQLMAPQRKDAELLQLAYEYQELTK